MIADHCCDTKTALTALTIQVNVMLSMLTRQVHLNKQEKRVNYLQSWEAGVAQQVPASKAINSSIKTGK